MDLIFGLACDGRAYPDFPGLGAGVVHAAVVGPTGLIDVLEVQLGLTGPRGAEAVRIAAYAAKLRAALPVSVNPFYAPSFARDPWATAKTLLASRDQLTAAGWTGGVIGSPRIDDLARAEAQTPPLPPGAPDRLRAVLADLADRPPLSIRIITLVEPRDLLTQPYRRLIDQIEACGVEIQAASPPMADSGNDLHRVQIFLRSGVTEPLQGDGAFMTVEADTALMAAEALAEWLAAGSEGDAALSAPGSGASG